MKNAIIVDLIKGFIKGNPKRILIAQRVLIFLSVVGYGLMLLSNNNIWTPPHWLIDTVFSQTGIVAQLSIIFGLQFAKKDINEGK